MTRKYVIYPQCSRPKHKEAYIFTTQHNTWLYKHI